MSLLKNKTEKCNIEVNFIGGSLNGQERWVDNPDAYLVIMGLAVPEGDELLQTPREIYKLRATKPQPLKYEVIWTKPN